MILYTLTGWLLGVLLWTILWQITISLHNLAGWSKHWITKNLSMSLGVIAMLAAAWELVAPLSLHAIRWILLLACVMYLLFSLQDLRDMSGDRRVGRKTFPLVFGEQKTRWFLSTGFGVRNAYKISIIDLVLGAGGIPVFIYLGFRTQSWQVFAVAGIVAIITGVAGLSAWMSRNGNPTWGIKLLVVANLAAVLLISLLIKNFGLIGGVAGILGILIFVTQTLPQREVNRSLIASMVVAMVAALLDWWSPESQLIFPGILSWISLLIGGLILGCIVLFIKQFKTYPLNTKLIIIFLGMLYLPLSGILALSLASLTLTEVQIRVFLLSTIVITGMVSFMAVVIAQLLANPITRLTTVAQQIAQGDLSIQVNVESGDEIGLLAIAFNQMTDKLLRRIEAEQAASAQAARLAGAEREQKEHLEGTIDDYLAFIERVAEGNLTVRLSLNDNDDALTILGGKLNRMVERLGEMTNQIREAAANTTAAATKILDATTQQALRGTEQSSAISQTTVTIDEVKAIVEQSFAKAQEVSDQAQRTNEVSQMGQQAVVATMSNMRQIKDRMAGIDENILALSEQTQQIGAIIATVNDIASQSNLLALNASIEAARAGEHGRGFNVVAVEVRNLAEQSRQATAQVKEILNEIQRATDAAVMAAEEGAKGVDDGVRQTNQTGVTLEQLAASITESASAAQQIVVSARQQTTGVEQITLAMQNIDQATVQNLASTQQTEKAAQDLTSLAQQMESMLARYKLD
jgi:methyl-accepting chemotaxis protein